VRRFFLTVTALTSLSVLSLEMKAQEHSVAREWNEMLLTSIRGDFARPTIHARNLFHVSAAMYDAWAIFNNNGHTYLIGKDRGAFMSEFNGFTSTSGDPLNDQIAEAISFAALRIMQHRFRFAPSRDDLLPAYEALAIEMGYDPGFASVDYSTGAPAALGNYIAQQYIAYGLVDGAQEEFDYANLYYQPANAPLEPEMPGNPNLTNLDRWQPLSLESFIDQSGNPVAQAPDFLSPEWGNVDPFSMTEDDKTTFERDEDTYQVYNDPGPPPLHAEAVSDGENDYRWGFELVSIWGAHLDPADGVMWDISPGAIGNISELPTTFTEHRSFYNEFDGGDPSVGRTMNPRTGMAYPANMVPRGDYARVLAEFWADGPDSETPPGHWFTILNYVSDHEALEKRFRGEGATLTDLEWDIKSYFIMGGTMHDAAISAWSIKGYYDYIRPISAIRGMAALGQSSDPNLPNYQENGITLKEGFIELVGEGDALAGDDNENVGKIKVYSWKGPDFIDDPETDMAGVGWILADNWWPYQRPTFVTPPFAGYVSGHSTYSRAAAEVLTLLTGDEYFPGGVGEFVAEQNEFLVFEEGPSVDVTLQWATYRDASDQTSLSRIWGGIHPPADDIPGRIIGERIGPQAFTYAETVFDGTVDNDVVTGTEEPEPFPGLTLGPNPVSIGDEVVLKVPSSSEVSLTITGPDGATVQQISTVPQNQEIRISTGAFRNGIYLIRLRDEKRAGTLKLLVVD